MNEREWEKRLRIHTAGREQANSARNAPYEPTPYSVLERLRDSGWLAKGDHLLDYGCGKGRVALFCAREIGCLASGVDFSAKLIQLANDNSARSGLTDRVRFHCGAAERHPLADETAFFFFHPFSDAVLRVVLSRILDSLYARPRPAQLIFYYPSDAYIAYLEGEPRLTPAGRIDCRDLFGDNAREELLRYRANIEGVLP